MRRLNVTPAQLRALLNLLDDIEAMSGGGGSEQDEIWWRYVVLLRRMLRKNGVQ